MKMGPGTFWGILLVLIGTSLIFKVLFHIDIPVLKIVLALFFILLGIKILVGHTGFFKFDRKGNDIIFGEMRVTANNLDYDEYNVIFGNGIFDLRDIEFKDSLNRYLKIATVFAGTEIILNGDLPVKIDSEAVFGGVRHPDGNSTAFGNTSYISSSYDPIKPHLIIKTETVFGGVDVKSY